MTVSVGMSAIHVVDAKNPFVDCVVFIPANRHVEAVDKVRAAMQKYRDYEYDTYGEAVEGELMDANIPHSIVRRPWNDDYDRPCIDSGVWEGMIAGLSICATVG